jgi:hypothetical protein
MRSMSRIKMLGLAAVAVLALAAFVGAASASAANTTLCNSALSPCPAANQYAANTVLNATLKTGTNAVLSTSGGLMNPTVTCTNSTVALKNTAVTGNPLPASVTSLAFNNGGTPPAACTSVNPTSTCTVTVNSLPYSGSVNLTTAGNGTLTVNNPNVTVACSGLPTCTYSASSVAGTVTGGNPAVVAFNSVALTVAGGFGCPTGATWTATYQLVNVGGSPTAVWVESP